MLSAIILVFMLIQFAFGSSYRSKLLKGLESEKSAGFTMKEIPDFQSSVKEKVGYKDIVQRPLFFKVRRPIEVKEDLVTPEISQVSGDFDFILTGIINTPNAFYCLLQDPRAKDPKSRFKRLEEGEVVEGRTIQEIKRDRVIIAYNGKTEEILLAKPRPKRRRGLRGRLPATSNPFRSAIGQQNSRKPNIQKPRVQKPVVDGARPSPATAKRNPFKLRKKYQ